MIGENPPPYPGWAANSAVLLVYLERLQDWHFEQVTIQKNESPEFASVIEEMPDTQLYPDRWEFISISVKYQTLEAMRAVRERWDRVCRTYEEGELWASREARIHRARFLSCVQEILRVAFMTREELEQERTKWENTPGGQLKYIQQILSRGMSLGKEEGEDETGNRAP
jgi:hypothetical protein